MFLFADKENAERVFAAMTGHNAAGDRYQDLIKGKKLFHLLAHGGNQFGIGTAVRNKTTAPVVVLIFGGKVVHIIAYTARHLADIFFLRVKLPVLHVYHRVDRQHLRPIIGKRGTPSALI